METIKARKMAQAAAGTPISTLLPQQPGDSQTEEEQGLDGFLRSTRHQPGPITALLPPQYRPLGDLRPRAA